MDWVLWKWANTKMDKDNFFIMKQNMNISKDDIGDYNLAIFTHAMDFFKEYVSFEKLIPKHFFTSLLNDLSTKDLLTLGNLLSTKFMNP
jgi:hypothetical protein